MSKQNNNFLFNTIAPVYGLFYNKQKKRYREVLNSVATQLDLASYKSILDVGCGTGSLCSILNERGLAVTGVDPAQNMLSIANRQPENKNILFLQANALEQLPFADKSFDLSIASYVAHGMQKSERIKLYSEMRRVTKSKVIIYDYNQKRSLMTSLIEWLEQGDYFQFIKNPKIEMESCVSEMANCFSEVKVIEVDTRASWYICTPS
ncbi:MAG: class I SAM-dependent methyltransferase [Clostridiales bacterium]|nr:class I SAM-dependent methyltransferase [Clostridiales bacterium]